MFLDPDNPTGTSEAYTVSAPHLNKLWGFKCPITKSRPVTSIAWNTVNKVREREREGRRERERGKEGEREREGEGERERERGRRRERERERAREGEKGNKLIFSILHAFCLRYYMHIHVHCKY